MKKIKAKNTNDKITQLVQKKKKRKERKRLIINISGMDCTMNQLFLRNNEDLSINHLKRFVYIFKPCGGTPL